MSACPHDNFVATVTVNRILDSGYLADVRIVCAQCQEPFRFIGIPAGVSFERPAVSIDNLEAHLPIEPQGVPTLQDSATFAMPPERRRTVWLIADRETDHAMGVPFATKEVCEEAIGRYRSGMLPNPHEVFVAREEEIVDVLPLQRPKES